MNIIVTRIKKIVTRIKKKNFFIISLFANLIKHNFSIIDKFALLGNSKK